MQGLVTSVYSLTLSIEQILRQRSSQRRKIPAGLNSQGRNKAVIGPEGERVRRALTPTATRWS